MERRAEDVSGVADRLASSTSCCTGRVTQSRARISSRRRRRADVEASATQQRFRDHREITRVPRVGTERNASHRAPRRATVGRRVFTCVAAHGVPPLARRDLLAARAANRARREGTAASGPLLCPRSSASVRARERRRRRVRSCNRSIVLRRRRRSCAWPSAAAAAAGTGTASR